MVNPFTAESTIEDLRRELAAIINRPTCVCNHDYRAHLGPCLSFIKGGRRCPCLKFTAPHPTRVVLAEVSGYQISADRATGMPICNCIGGKNGIVCKHVKEFDPSARNVWE